MKYLRSKIFGYRDPDSVALRSWQDILTLHRGDHRKAVHTLLTQWGVPRWTFWRDFAVVDLEGSGLEYPALIVDIRTGRWAPFIRGFEELSSLLKANPAHDRELKELINEVGLN